MLPSRKSIFFLFIIITSFTYILHFHPSILPFHSSFNHPFIPAQSISPNYKKPKWDIKKVQATQQERQAHIHKYCQQHYKVDVFLDYNNYNTQQQHTKLNTTPSTTNPLNSLKSKITQRLQIKAGNSASKSKVLSQHKGHEARYLLPRDFNALFYNDKHKVIYCEVPKVACTNWKRTLLYLSGKLHVSDLKDIPSDQVHSNLSNLMLTRMDTLTAQGITSRIAPAAGYFKFMFVREPFQRLLSAYRNKFESPYSAYFHDKYGTEIIRSYRKTNRANNHTSQNLGKDVKFEEFVRFVIGGYEEGVMGQLMNPHWRPISELCLPCSVGYDWVGKQESMQEWEADWVLSKLKMASFSFPPSYHPGNDSTLSVLEGSYGLLRGLEVLALRRLYSEDLKMFYPRDDTYERLMKVVKKG